MGIAFAFPIFFTYLCITIKRNRVMSKTPLIIIGPGGTIKHNDTNLPDEEILKQIKDLEVIKVPDIIKVIPEDILMPKVYFQDPVERKSDNQPWAKCNRWGKRIK